MYTYTHTDTRAHTHTRHANLVGCAKGNAWGWDIASSEWSEGCRAVEFKIITLKLFLSLIGRGSATSLPCGKRSALGYFGSSKERKDVH